MSGLSIALVLLAATPARGAEETATVADNLDARHHIGFQLGGSAFAQIVYRLRVVGHAYLEIGGAAVPEGTLNTSVGFVVAHATGTRFFPYAGAGVGFGGMSGRDANKNAAGQECGIDTPGCSWSSRTMGFFHIRAGAGVVLDTARHISLGLDIGSWIGATSHVTDDGNGGRTSSSRRIVWPMAGLAFLYSF
jgi:hypothetical protein